MHTNVRGPGAFTLIELVIIIVVLGILAAVAIPRMGGLTENSRINATKSEMAMLKRAIVGNAQVTSGGRYIDVGFEGDVGSLPDSLVELALKPAAVASYDKFSRRGWNGPYVDASGDDYLNDSWGTAYQYDKAARTITSSGGADAIVISF